MLATGVALSVIVLDPDFPWTFGGPFEHDPPLIVDAN
jgi:hypothetical protein